MLCLMHADDVTITSVLARVLDQRALRPYNTITQVMLPFGRKQEVYYIYDNYQTHSSASLMIDCGGIDAIA